MMLILILNQFHGDFAHHCRKLIKKMIAYLVTLKKFKSGSYMHN
jgi:hypothetical protein